MNEVHLVISDCHVTADQNLDRFDWLAELINDIEPTKIICIGDFASLDSLSTHHNPGSKTDHELPSFRAEQSAVETALQKMFKYDPVCGDRIMLMGNHEQRWDRFKERFPKVLDHVDIEEWLGYNKHWDFIHPYKAWAEIDGLMYTHVPHTIMGKPVGGANACRTVATLPPRWMPCVATPARTAASAGSGCHEPRLARLCRIYKALVYFLII